MIDEGGDVGDAISLDDVRERGRGLDTAALEERAESVEPDDPYTFIYTSGTTGPPKGCVLLHSNYRSVVNSVNQRGLLTGDDDLVYLFLPLAHAFALLIQLASVDTGTAVAYFGGDAKQIIPELMQVHPTYLPSVPRIFEKLFTLAQQQLSEEEITAIRDDRRPDPGPREPRRAGARRPARALRAVRAEGRVRARPVRRAPARGRHRRGADLQGDPRVLLRRRRPGHGGLRHDRDGDRRDDVDAREPQVRLGRPRAARASRSRSPTTARSCSRAATSSTATRRTTTPASARSSTAGCTPATSGRVDEDGYIFITGRKKDIIITAGGKNLTPANLENDLKQTRWVSQAVMHGDRRPFPVMLITLDEEEIVPWAEQQGIEDTSIAALASHPEVHALIQAELDKANEKYAQVEQVKKFFILDHDLTQETGELTPTLKVKRNVVNEKYAERFDALYGG